jgi:5-methylcytosine-specific restriction endonuclease McrA
MRRRSSSSAYGLRTINSKSRRKLMARILERDGVCVYCGETAFLNIDHVIPVTIGGNNNEDNLVACCELCNHEKGDLLPAESGKLIIYGGLDKHRTQYLNTLRRK